MTIETQVWLITVSNVILILIVAYQSLKLGKLSQTTYGRLEAVAWITLLLFRLYALRSLSITIEQAKAGGLIRDSFTSDQWVSVSGNLLFIVMMIFTKCWERRAIKKSWGV